MSQEDISQSVRAFISEQINSVMELELLLLLHQRGSRASTAADLAAELRVDPAWVGAELARYRSRGLLAAAEPPPGALAVNAENAQLLQTLSDLEKAYSDRRVSVIGLIFSKPTEKIRSFADAFRIRKDSTDG